MVKFEEFRRPRTRAEFERSLFILGEKLRNGKLSFAPHVTRAMDGIRRVRCLPNGRVDFASVDEAARLTANQMSYMAERIPMIQPPSLDAQSDRIIGKIGSPIDVAEPKKKSPKKKSPKKKSPKKKSR